MELGAIRVREGDEEAIISVLRTEGSDGTISVDYSINDGTARDGSDYTGSSGTLTFGPGETKIDVRVPILADNQPEVDETFNIAIGSPIGAVLGAIRSAVITITDDDTTDEDTVAFEDAEYSIGENAGEASIDIVRTGNIDRTATVNYALGDDYARAGLDFASVSGTVTFQPGEARQTFAVPILEDELQEFDESLTLTLTDPVGSNLGVQSSAQLTIVDNDEAPFTFEREVVVSGLAEGERVARFSAPPGPTAFDWAPDGTMFIANLDGVVQIFDNGELLEQPFIDISEQVNTGGQRGLLGLAVHPDFPESPYVYLAYSYDAPGVEPDTSNTLRPTRLVRVEADPASGYREVLPGSEVILLETPPVSNFHAAGAIKFAEDGSLFFTHGDGTQVGNTPTPEQAELLQSLDNPFGKLFRIDPLTGEGYADNPFFDGDTTSTQSKIYNYGLRNPWRYTLHPETGVPFIGDVGWTNWEEINTGRGENFGWPLFEGGNGVSRRTEALADLPEFETLFQGASDVTAPLFALRHPTSRSITLGDFYTGEAYPDFYEGALFFADNTVGGVSALLFDEQGNIDSAIPFADEELGITQISVGPDSNLYFANVFSGEIGRWVPASINENETLIGGNSGDVLNGGAGDDVLRGQEGNDTLAGEAGDDTLKGGAGDDSLTGGAGDDTVIVNDFSGVDVFDGGSGKDVIRFLPSDGRNINVRIAEGFVGDRREGGQFFENFERVLTGSGNDSLFGDANNNELFSGAGNDTFEGGAGNDILKGGSGNDVIDGGSGDDTVIVNDFSGVDFFDGGEGNDAIRFLPSDGRNINVRIAEGFVGDRREGVQFFENFESVLTGSGDDSLFGNDDDNQLYGANGQDTLLGGGGDDLLAGGLGDDWVTGGSGSDTFILASDDGTDQITDFERGEDLIALAGGLSFAELSFSGDQILLQDQALAVLDGIATTSLVETDFISVA
ncbi:Bifunctional hemolysin/adenylate cyclase [Acaryochloris thomasi RCC1774]|uniref:Bifunctional hemolysin/adenylate cyclase n=1 Tax=Acaryochloris thomasi RCC1774 TaxID=1764569 RepID=A0A2W1JVC3_9CYAN|nr:Bifunctional hemolysin/adenylate cyclase [Acaryochloris thomasi RCC1774]